MNSEDEEKKKEEERKQWAEELAYSSIGIQLALSVIIGAFVGMWLDNRFNMFPTITILLTLLGMLSGFWNAYKITRQNK